jgi:thioredoxin reductase (NADPH)
MNKNNPDENIIILGAGPAGLSAALYAARAELNPLVLTGTDLGGQAALTDRIENYPGFPEGIGGIELAELFQKNAERFGARVMAETVSAVDFSKTPYMVKTYDKEFSSRCVIIATGASPRKMGIPGENEFRGRGVSYCATCDGWFFKNKTVAVIGGGDSALEEGLFLTRFAGTVHIIHRRSELRAGAILQKRARENSKLKFIWNSVVEEIIGPESVTNLSLRNIETGEKSSLDVDGVFIFIGHLPNTSIFAKFLQLDEKGYLKVDQRMRTNIPGILAAGEVADPIYRQVITSAGMGAAAAIEATRYLENLEG